MKNGKGNEIFVVKCENLRRKKIVAIFLTECIVVSIIICKQIKPTIFTLIVWTVFLLLLQTWTMENCLRWTWWMEIFNFFPSWPHFVCSLKRKIIKAISKWKFFCVCLGFFLILFITFFGDIFNTVWCAGFSIWQNIRNDETFEFSKFRLMNKTCW